jgi:CubicO group peptidase (beta-lactamase class C family)
MDHAPHVTSRSFAIAGDAVALAPLRRAMLATCLATACALAPADVASAGELPTARPEAVGIAREGLTDIAELLEARIEAGELTGAVTGIARRGRVVHLEARGMMDLEAGKPMQTDAIFRMASSTKPVTAVAILMLREQGKLDLDAPVHRFVPELRDLRVAVRRAQTGVGTGGTVSATPQAASADASGAASAVELVPAARDITIRDLLTHTSGLLSGGDGARMHGPVQPQPTDTLADFIPRLAKAPLDFQPGTKWSYSPLAGMDTLGRIVEVASGMTFDAFLRERIFKPLGMKDTFFVLPEDRKERLVTLYRRGSDGTLQQVEWGGLAGRGGYFSGAGGLYSTARDYLHFEQMLLREGELFGMRILSPESVRALRTNQVGDKYRGLRGGRAAGIGFGFGVAVVLDQRVAGASRSTGAFGWGGAFGTATWTDPEQELTVVYMVQQPSFELLGEFEHLVMRSIVD